MFERVSTRNGRRVTAAVLALSMAATLGAGCAADEKGYQPPAGVTDPHDPGEGNSGVDTLDSLDAAFGDGKIDNYPGLEQALSTALGRDVWPPSSTLDWRYSDFANEITITDFDAKKSIALFHTTRFETDGIDTAAGLYRDNYWSRYQGTDLTGDVFVYYNKTALRIVTGQEIIGIDINFIGPPKSDPNGLQNLVAVGREYLGVTAGD